ncbi:MAG TPA: Hsp70 family protein [Pyrinomonadaceae bacterium]|jgi:molecular chaperone DnaK
MLFKLGLDFGTTTSILSFIKDEKLRVYYYGGETDGGTPYVPTVVLYEKNDLLIGHFALETESEDAQPERYFKMRLPLNEDDAKAKSAEDLTADFIGEFIKGTCPSREKLAGERLCRDAFAAFLRAEVESLVIAIPHAWDEDKKAIARNRLRKAVGERLNLPLSEFVSEPFAAAAFFLHRYKENKKEDFKGNLLVCDMGGGTFDVTLCRIGINSTMKLIAKAGSGNADGFGIAGNYFDQALIENCYGKVEPFIFSELMRELDREKKNKIQARRLEAVLAKEKPRGIPIYNLRHDIGNVTVKIDHLEDAFAGVKESIDKVLEEALKQARQENETIDRVILVGGFAKFPLVRNAILDFLTREDLEADNLLDLETLTTDEMAYAISYGACLIANDLIETSEKFKTSIGVNVTGTAGIDSRIELIKAGTTLGKLADGTLGIDHKGRKIPFRIGLREFQVEFIVAADGGEPFTRMGNFIFPKNFDFENKRFFIGAKVDKHSVPHLILQDEESGERFETSLESIIKK